MPANTYPTLVLGSRGENVRKLQTYLNQLGQTAAVDGVFGPETRQAVITFQALVGLPADGIVGPDTWQSISDNLGMSLDLDGTPDTATIPEVGGPPGEPFLTPGKLIAGGLIFAGVAAVLYGGRKR